MRTALWVAAIAAMVSACSPTESQSGEAVSMADVAEAPSAEPEGPTVASGGETAAPLTVTLPQLAYSYTLGFLLPEDRIAPVQAQHVAACEKLGPARCQLIGMESAGGEDGAEGARLRLRVSSGIARRFQVQLGASVDKAGGRAIRTVIGAEDVSKDIVDAQARIAQRELLVSRLTEILRTRQGKVSELVEAERSVAQAQEELDKAKSWLAELRGRVAMSDFTITYSAVAPRTSPATVGDQLGEAVSGSAAVFVQGLRALLTLFIYLLPWIVITLPIVLVVRALTRARAERRAARIGADTEEAEPPESVHHG